MMKSIPLTLAFNDQEIIGRIELDDMAIARLKENPNQCITFAFDRNYHNPVDRSKWRLFSSALIPIVNVRDGHYWDTEPRRPEIQSPKFPEDKPKKGWNKLWKR